MKESGCSVSLVAMPKVHYRITFPATVRGLPFPYTSMTDASYWTMPAVLPQEAYDSELGGKCSDEDYELAKKVCLDFGIRTQEQYHDLYL